MKKQGCGVIAAVIVLLLVFLVPAPSGLDPKAWYLLGILFSAVAMWLTNAFPKLVVTLYIMGACTFAGIFSSFDVVLQSFMSQPVMMVLGSFLLAAMFQNTDLPLRLVGSMTKITRDNGKAFLLVIMIATALVASVIADIGAAIIFFTFTVSVFRMERGIVTEDNLQLKKALLIGIPTSALAGSLLIPIGGPANLVVMGMLQSAAGITITFFQWFAILGPVTFIVVFVLWFFLCITLKPKRIDPIAYQRFSTEFEKLGKLKPVEIRALVVLILMIGMWIAGTWVPILGSGMVVIIGAIIMFLPKMNILTIEDFSKEASWDLFFFLPGIMIISAGASSTGLINWLVNSSFGGLSGIHPLLLIFIASALLVLLRIVIPAGPPITILAIPALMTIGMSANVSPTIMMCVGITWGALPFILPFDIVKALTYEYGQFTISEMWRAEIPTIIVLLIVLSLYIPFMVGVVM